MYIRDAFLDIIENAIRNAFDGTVVIGRKEIDYSVLFPAGEHADISSSVAFRIAKIVKDNPKNVADKIIESVKPINPIVKMSNLNGYINAQLDEKEYCRMVIDEIEKKKGKYGNLNLGNLKKVVIEFPSVNPNKPWHIGHLRCALLGDSISNVMEHCNYKVERMDYIDDLGLQMAEILLAIGNKKIEKKYDLFLGEEYVRINTEIREGHLESKVSDILKKMEETETEENRRVREIAERCVHAQYETAFDYGIYHDSLVFETDVVREGLFNTAMDLLKKEGMASIRTDGNYKGCLVLGSKETEEGEGKVLIRSTGVPTYIGKDIAFHMWKLGILEKKFRFNEFIKQPNGKIAYSSSQNGREMDFGGSDLAINIIGSAQQLNQKLLSDSFEILGNGRKSIVHLAYGEVNLKEGSLSGRSGGWMGSGANYTADDLLRETTTRIIDVSRKNKKLEEGKINSTSKKVAVGAIRFEYLRIDPLKKVIFEWNRALDLESNSGPYCMYMHARATSIIEKAGYTESLKVDDYKQMTRGYDFELIKLLGNAEEIVRKACVELRPNVIAEYLIDISSAFSRFYENMPVLTGGDAMRLRLAIVIASKQVINNMLGLLGIETVEKM